MRLYRAIVLVGLAAAAGCSSGSTQSCGGKCADVCEVAATTPVAWADETPLGSPAQLFSSFAGACQAPFAWDASGWGNALTVVPIQGKSTLTAAVEIDRASARLLTHAQAGCPDVLEVGGTATLTLPEGTIADHQPFALSATAGMTLVALGLTVKEADFGAWVSIQKSDPASTLSMPISMNAVGRTCSGQVGLSTNVVHNGIGSGAGGPLGSWSDTKL